MQHVNANPYYVHPFYVFGWWISRFIFGVIGRRQVVGRNHIPPLHHRGIIFAANHRSLGDPNLLGSAVPYPIHFFAKEELFRIPLLGWYIRRVNAFPVRRFDHDVSAFKTACRVLEAREGLVMFPEGGRRKGDKQWKAKPGVGMLACKTNALVVPVRLINSDHLLGWARLKVIFGTPLEPPQTHSREAYEEFSHRIMQAIRDLHP